MISRGADPFQDYPPGAVWRKGRLDTGDRIRDIHSRVELLGKERGRREDIMESDTWSLVLGELKNSSRLHLTPP